jgi:hypothetical protein
MKQLIPRLTTAPGTNRQLASPWSVPRPQFASAVRPNSDMVATAISGMRIAHFGPESGQRLADIGNWDHHVQEVGTPSEGRLVDLLRMTLPHKSELPYASAR